MTAAVGADRLSRGVAQRRFAPENHRRQTYRSAMACSCDGTGLGHAVRRMRETSWFGAGGIERDDRFLLRREQGVHPSGGATLLGVIPGIGVLAAISMLFPMTVHLEPTAALIMLAGIWYGTSYGGSTASILLNVPGSPSNAVTAWTVTR